MNKVNHQIWWERIATITLMAMFVAIRSGYWQ